jgi:DNA polymerase lambda
LNPLPPPLNTHKMTDSKQTVIDHLDTMRQGDLIRGEKFSAIAYSKAIKALKNLPGPLTSADQVKGIKGIGVKIRAKITEIIATGELASATRTRNELDLKTYEALLKVHGIGPVKARELVKDHKITGIDHLRKNQQLLNDVQRLGLKYYEDILERIPRDEMEKHETLLMSHLPSTCEGVIVGSYRRKAADSGDIDMLIRFKGLHKKSTFTDYVEVLKAAGYLNDILALGPKKCMAVVTLPGGKARRLDLLVTPAAAFAYSILYFTGSDVFNVAFRSHCLTKGYTLNEHALTPTREDVPEVPVMKTEEDIFRFVGIKYVAPEFRGSSEITLL